MGDSIHPSNPTEYYSKPTQTGVNAKGSFALIISLFLSTCNDNWASVNFWSLILTDCAAFKIIINSDMIYKCLWQSLQEAFMPSPWLWQE